MSKTKAFILTLSTVFFLLLGQAQAAESDFVQAFIKAYDSKDIRVMSKLIKANKDKIPAEVRVLVKEGLDKGLSKVDKTSRFFTAELIARAYKDLTDDAGLLIELKKAEFNSSLNNAVTSEAVNGINTINIPLGTDKEKNVFIPDNIIINEGETVQWKNNDSTAHIFASMPLIGNGGIFTPSLKAGATWEYKFDKPGEYFYLCFIHKGMVGKVTVLAAEKKEPVGTTEAQQPPAE